MAIKKPSRPGKARGKVSSGTVEAHSTAVLIQEQREGLTMKTEHGVNGMVSGCVVRRKRHRKRRNQAHRTRHGLPTPALSFGTGNSLMGQESIQFIVKTARQFWS